METTRAKAAAAVTLIGGAVAVVLQYIVTPLGSGTAKGAEMLDTAAAHHSAMGWAVALDLVVLVLAAPAFLFLAALGRWQISKLAAIGAVLLFGGFLLSIPAIDGLDALAFFGSGEPDRAAAAHLLDTWQNSGWFAVGVLPYLLGQIVGSILLAIAYVKAKAVPLWVAIATGTWPILQIVGIEGGVKPIAILAYVALLAAWSGCAVAILKPSATMPARSPELVTG